MTNKMGDPMTKAPFVLSTPADEESGSQWFVPLLNLMTTMMEYPTI